jgi:hypothetical protein
MAVPMPERVRVWAEDKEREVTVPSMDRVRTTEARVTEQKFHGGRAR